MNRLLPGFLLCGLLLANAAVAVDSETPIKDPQRQALYEEIIHEVRCLVCQNETIADSTAPLAADLRREIRGMVVEGQSEDQIKTFLLNRYGDFVLYRPRFKESTALLWLAPVLLVALGALTLGLILRRRAGLPSDVDADENPAPAEKPR